MEAEIRRLEDAEIWVPALLAVAPAYVDAEAQIVPLDLLGDRNTIIDAQTKAWSKAVNAIGVSKHLQAVMDGSPDQIFDDMWLEIDKSLWRQAKKLGRTPSSLAELFGLYDPADENRPTLANQVLDDLTDRIQALDVKDNNRVLEPFVSWIPVATAQHSVARAPPRSMLDRKVKLKKRKAGKPPPVPSELDELASPDLPLPQALPATWPILSRKHMSVIQSLNLTERKLLLTSVMQVFRSLLGKAEKCGPIRWDDFEKVSRV